MKNQLILAAICTLLLSSCAQVYRPSMTPTPLFTEKGQTSFEGAYSRDGINVSAATAVTSSIAIMGNGQFNINSYRYLSLDKNPSNGKYGELALGYFKKGGKDLVFETYAGFGKGEMTDQYDISPYSNAESFHYNKYFLQPNIGWNFKNNLQLILTPRVSYLSGNYIGKEGNILNGVPTDTQLNFASFEPTMTFGFGNKNWKGYIQSGINLNEYSISYNISSLYNFGAGIKYNFQWKKK